ncbi:hypothetical protein ILYODFUR_037085 [Ilyodon furcidens]|uniref:Uncharacterized protein n=1 Tax=Ilyodon furcidens TaxID=33524 RepID=A0ABV0U3N3_9TELE
MFPSYLGPYQLTTAVVPARMLEVLGGSLHPSGWLLPALGQWRDHFPGSPCKAGGGSVSGSGGGSVPSSCSVPLRPGLLKEKKREIIRLVPRVWSWSFHQKQSVDHHPKLL